MYRSHFALGIVLAGVISSTVAASASTLEYTFSVPYEVKSLNIGSQSGGAGAGKSAPPMSVTCAVGPVSLAYSTGTNSAQNATGTGTTDNVSRSPATVVVTVDAEPRGDLNGTGAPKDGAGGVLQPTKPGGYYTCWATFATGQTPVNFLPTTALPKTGLKQGAIK